MLLEDVRNFQARSRMQLLCQCLPFSKKLGSLHRVKPQWPPPRLGLQLAYRLCLSPILVGQRGALPDEYVPAGQPMLQRSWLRAQMMIRSRLARSWLLRSCAWSGCPQRHLRS